jgi:hypothetical protein
VLSSPNQQSRIYSEGFKRPDGLSPDPSTDFVANGLLDGPLLNAAGDFVYTQLLPGQNPFDDVQYFQAVLVPAPEPANILLLDTGVIALIGAAIRRRMRS